MEQETKSIIDRIWTNFWEGGVTNPLTVIEQITYLLFIKGLDDIDIAHEKSDHMLGIKTKRIFDEKHQECRWSIFKNYPAEKMYKIVGEDVFPFIKSLGNNKNSGYAKYMEDAIFIIPTPIMLQRVVTAIDKLKMKDRDTKGDVYEYLLSKLSTAGTNGQFRTPRHIIKMMVELMKPTPEDIIVDPAAGSAGFLVEAGEYLRNNRNDLFLTKNLKEHFNNTMFYGFDMDRTMLRIGAMNLMQHGIENPNISYKDSLSEDNEDNSKYTLVLANPPFKGTIDNDRKSKTLMQTVKTSKTELLFLALFIRILRVGGRCATIVPDGVMFGTPKEYVDIRKEIVNNQKLEAIISMPAGVFKPYTPQKTYIMIFTKTNSGGTDKVWFYNMENDGLSLDDQRNPINENDIPDIIKRFNNRYSIEEQKRKRTEKSFFVSKQEIIKNNFDLSINKYIEYAQPKEENKVSIESIIEAHNSMDKVFKNLLETFQKNNILDYKYNEKVVLGDVLEYEQPNKYIVKSTKYTDNPNDIPVLTAGKTFILGYTKEENDIYDATIQPVILFDDFTTSMQYVDFKFKVKSSAMKILKCDSNRANLKYLYYYLKNIKFDTERHKRYWISEYSKQQIELPSLEIQKSIVDKIEKNEANILFYIKKIDTEKENMINLLKNLYSL